MNLPMLFAQMSHADQGWLTTRLLAVTLTSAEWVLWLLVGLSVLSIGVMLERAAYFASHRLSNSDAVLLAIARGDLAAVRAAISERKGMEAAVLREGLAWSEKSAEAVQEVIDAVVATERPRYERSLSLLGTLGANTPFIGLFGTVLGIIKAFNDLSLSGAKGANIQSTVMAGVSEALVATAMGLAVAIPAVVGYNMLTRAVKNTVARSAALGHALVGHLKASGR